MSTETHKNHDISGFSMYNQKLQTIQCLNEHILDSLVQGEQEWEVAKEKSPRVISTKTEIVSGKLEWDPVDSRRGAFREELEQKRIFPVSSNNQDHKNLVVPSAHIFEANQLFFKKKPNSGRNQKQIGRKKRAEPPGQAYSADWSRKKRAPFLSVDNWNPEDRKSTDNRLKGKCNSS